MDDEPQTVEQLRQRLAAVGERLQRMRQQIDALPPFDPATLRRLLPILLTRTYHIPPPEPKARCKQPARAIGPKRARKPKQRVEPFDWLLHRFSRVE
jgi:hypothetical protein